MAPFKQTTLPAHLNPEKRGPGRPSAYRPEYDDMVVDYMAKGRSLSAFAGSIRQTRNTIYDWIKTHSTFSEAVARARMARVEALEIKLLASRKGAETSAAIFALKNADPTEWRDLKQTEHRHTITAETLTDQQLYAIASGVSPGDAGIIDAEYQVLEPK